MPSSGDKWAFHNGYEYNVRGKADANEIWSVLYCTMWYVHSVVFKYFGYHPPKNIHKHTHTHSCVCVCVFAIHMLVYSVHFANVYCVEFTKSLRLSYHPKACAEKMTAWMRLTLLHEFHSDTNNWKLVEACKRTSCNKNERINTRAIWSEANLWIYKLRISHKIDFNVMLLLRFFLSSYVRCPVYFFFGLLVIKRVCTRLTI